MYKTCSKCGTPIRQFVVAFLGKRWMDESERAECPGGGLHVPEH